ncbi:MAG TPA: glycosyltransferase [Pirellulales bacterium]|nr:glycosyltransferase [Pirellulales bacterium]
MSPTLLELPKTPLTKVPFAEHLPDGNVPCLHGAPANAPPPPATDILRVLHVVNGEHYAGAERVQDLLALRLPQFGVDVAIACIKPDRFPTDRHCQNTPLFSLPMRSRFDLRPAWRLARIVRAQRFDLIHTHTPRTALIGQIAARLAGVPLVHHVHGHTATEVGCGWLARLSAYCERASLTRVAAIIAVSPSSADYIRRWRVATEQVHLVPNGVSKRSNLANRRAPKNSWTVGMVALLRPRKGLEVLLESLAILNSQGMPVKLRVIGGFETPQYQEHSLQLACELGIGNLVEWRGFRQNINSELDELDLLVLPSILPEGMPMAVLEAMASGVPPIGSRVEGIADVIRHGHDGLLTEPNNAGELANNIAAVVTGKHDWQSLRANAVASHAERFSDTAMAAGVAEIYRSALKR